VGEHPQPGPGAATVLIVDDSTTLRRLLRKELEASGYCVVEAADGDAALLQLQAHAVRLVITDLNMDPMDGFELVRRIRLTRPRESLPVLFLTTESGDDLKVKGKGVGANGWLVKPLVAPRLHAALEHLLSRASATP
jgi:two-component system chemotaxis response regulator CheY